MPAHLTGKMERCVTRVMNGGKSKSSAIAICHASIMKEATMAKKDKLSRARRLEQKANREKKAEMLREFAEELEAAEPGIEQLTEEAVQAVEEGKDYGDDMPMSASVPYGGATTFAALDAYDAAREQASAVSDLTRQMRCLVDNIMDDATITDKAGAIASLAGEFQSRVQNPSMVKDAPTDDPLPNPDDDDSELHDEDEPMYVSIEKRLKEPGVVERMRNAVVSLFKTPLGSASMNDLPDSAFAYIESGGSRDAGGRTVPRSLRHYPIHDKPHVRNALARAAAQMNGGGKGADIAKRAMSKIRAAAKRMGIGEPATQGKSSSFFITKQTDGSFRWVGWVTNKWVDKDHEILTDAAHKEYVEWLDAHPDQAPHWYTWHTPVREAKADLWDYVDGYLIMSGPATEEEAKAYEPAELLGMSHGFFVHERDSTNPLLITKYRTVEVSDLPVEAAANPWTAFEVARKELTMKFSDKKRAYLVSKLGEVKVGELENKTGDMVKELEALGIESKESDEVKTPEPTLEAKPVLTDPVPSQSELVKAVMDALKVTELNAGLVALKAQADKVPELEKQLKALGEQLVALQKSDDQKVAEVISPKTKPMEWFRASQDKSTALNPAKPEDDKLKKAAPKYEWLENALGDVVPS